MHVYRAALAAITAVIVSTGATHSDNKIIEPSLAALETALINDITPTCNRQGLLSELVDIGQLYCSMKQSGEIPWKSEMSSVGRMYDHMFRDDKYQSQEYHMNMNNGIELAVKKWILLHFGSEDAYGKWLQSFPKDTPQFGCATTEVAMKDIAAGEADRHLCPGWPGHPRPRD